MFPYDISNIQADFNTNLPQWVLNWMNWIMIINLLSVVFLKHKEARWVLLGIIGAVAGNYILYPFFGLSRILGLGHVIVWTPLVIYLFKQLYTRKKIKLKSIYGIWLQLLLLTILVSLAFDYTDVMRYLLGEREVITATAQNIPLP